MRSKELFIRLLILTLLFVSSCKTKQYSCVTVIPGNIEFSIMQDLNKDVEIDTNKIKSVEIYSYKFSKRNKVKDSTLLAFENINRHLELYSRIIYNSTYDSLGREKERFAFDKESNKTWLNTRSKYDVNSNLSESISYNKDGKINSKTFYKYDSLNRFVKSKKYYGHFLFKEPKLDNEITVEYDNDNNKIREVVENYDTTSKNQLFYRLTKEFDESGNVVREKNETYLHGKVSDFYESDFLYEGNRLVGEVSSTGFQDSLTKNTKTYYKYKNDLIYEIKNHDYKTNNLLSITRFYYFSERK